MDRHVSWNVSGAPHISYLLWFRGWDNKGRGKSLTILGTTSKSVTALSLSLFLPPPSFFSLPDFLFLLSLSLIKTGFCSWLAQEWGMEIITPTYYCFKTFQTAGYWEKSNLLLSLRAQTRGWHCLLFQQWQGGLLWPVKPGAAIGTGGTLQGSRVPEETPGLLSG